MGSIISTARMVEEKLAQALKQHKKRDESLNEALRRIAMEYGCPIALGLLTCDPSDGVAVFNGPYAIFRSMVQLHGDLLRDCPVYYDVERFVQYHGATDLGMVLTSLREQMAEIIISGLYSFDRRQLSGQFLLLKIKDSVHLVNSGPQELVWITLAVEGFVRNRQRFGRCAAKDCRKWFVLAARGRAQRFCSMRCQNRIYMRGVRPDGTGGGMPSKLKPEDIQAIRDSEDKQRAIADSFGISQSYVSRIRLGHDPKMATKEEIN